MRFGTHLPKSKMMQLPPDVLSMIETRARRRLNDLNMTLLISSESIRKNLPLRICALEFHTHFFFVPPFLGLIGNGSWFWNILILFWSFLLLVFCADHCMLLFVYYLLLSVALYTFECVFEQCEYLFQFSKVTFWGYVAVFCACLIVFFCRLLHRAWALRRISSFRGWTLF